MTRAELEAESSMLAWYPKIRDHLPTPRTVMVEVDFHACCDLLDGTPLNEETTAEIFTASDCIGYPLFLRTDQTSAKHRWRHTCYVHERKDLLNHIVTLVDENLCKDLYFRALVFRELLPLVHYFTAFEGLPIAKERRYFVKDGTVLCHHPYWPANAIKFWDRGYGVPEPDEWPGLLRELNRESDGEIANLSRLARGFSARMPGAWSVDFAAVNRPYQPAYWVLIDAARAEVSWHPADCPNCPEEQREKRWPREATKDIALFLGGFDTTEES